jgi:type VI secretion system protein VasI
MNMKKLPLIIISTFFLIVACDRSPSQNKIQSTTSVSTLQSSSTIDAKQVLQVKELAECSSKDNSTQRLKCFDDLSKKYNQASISIDTTSKSKGAWITSTDTDPLTDKPIYFAQLDAIEGKGRFGDKITLTIRCKNRKTEAYIDWATFLGTDEINVTSRVDKSSAAKNSWSISTNNKATFMPQAAMSLKKFVNSTGFVVNLTPYNENPITAVFDITGAEEAFSEIRQECKW